MSIEPYREFLEAKICLAERTGIEIDAGEVSPILMPFQRDIVRWAIAGGCRALFESFGLGKTFQQIEILRLILKHRGGMGLIVVPLGVRQEFISHGLQMGVQFQFIRSDTEMDGPGFYLTNYESVLAGKVTPSLFTVASLDEAAVLRSFGSKTYQAFLSLFRKVPYRFVATATPDPNRHKELIHYAAFLGIMDSGQSLTRFFQRNSEKAGDLTLYPHREAEFWIWVHSWAAFIQRPSDLGYSDDGYDRPPLDIRYHEVAVDHAGAKPDRDGQGALFRSAALGVVDAAREKRDTLDLRIAKLKEIVEEDPADHMILWHDLEAEREAIQRAVPSALPIYGSLDLDIRETNTLAFAAGEAQYLATKPELSGAGPNLQHHCHRAVFAGIGYKFHDLIQAIHRIHRFGQAHRCRLDIIYAESEREVLQGLQAKWARYDAQCAKMAELIRKYGLYAQGAIETLTRTIGVKRMEVGGGGWTLVHNDSVDEAARMDSDSIDLIVTSVPFGNHYEYSASYNDFGHTRDNEHFFAQMDFLTPNLLRILKPGRLACIHTKDRIRFGSVTGFGRPTVDPFHADCIAHYRKHGFGYMGMITVVTDVVRENNQTYRLGWSEQCKDGTKMGVGSPEYIILMCKLPTDRSKSYADEPVRKDKKGWDRNAGPVIATESELDDEGFPTGDVVNIHAGGWDHPDGYSRARWQIDAHAHWRESGNRLLSPEELCAMGPEKLAKAFAQSSLQSVYSYEDHVRIGEALESRGALPATFMAIAPGSHDPDVWTDIVRMHTLNADQVRTGGEKHVCPLQFGIVDRLIHRYSNPGDLVYDPFGGLGTVPLRAVRLKRRGYASELNADYFHHAVGYLQAAERELSMPDLFAALGTEDVA